MGIWPFNQDIVSKEAMALSKESSCEGHMPVEAGPELQAIEGLLQRLKETALEALSVGFSVTMAAERTAERTDVDAATVTDSDVVKVETADNYKSGSVEAETVRETISYLASGDAVYLVSPVPVTSLSNIPAVAANPIPPVSITFQGFSPILGEDNSNNYHSHGPN